MKDHAAKPTRLPMDAPPALPLFRDAIDALKRDLIVRALALTNGNRAEAGRRLGLSRAAATNIMRRLKITEAR